jgi:hypothetical protein
MDSSVLWDYVFPHRVNLDVASFFCCIRVEIKLAIDVLCCALSLLLLDMQRDVGSPRLGLPILK